MQQPDFTWGRIVSNLQTGASWTYEVLDVVGSNNVWCEHGPEAFARRADDVPHPRASDHWPLGLQWLERRARSRPRKPHADCLVK